MYDNIKPNYYKLHIQNQGIVMDVREYLHKKRMELQELSKKSGVNKQTLSALKCHNTKPSFRTATQIVHATKHEVGYADLIPEIYGAIVNEYITKKGEKNGNEN